MEIKKTREWERGTLKTNKSIVLIDLDGVLCNFDKRYEELKKIGITEPKIWKHENAYKDLEPIENAIEAWNLLQGKYDTYILSTPPWSAPNAWAEKRIWVEKYLGSTAKKKLILCHNKGIINGDYLVDDRSANGVQDFTGEHILFGSEKFPDWKSVLVYLKAI